MLMRARLTGLVTVRKALSQASTSERTAGGTWPKAWRSVSVKEDGWGMICVLIGRELIYRRKRRKRREGKEPYWPTALRSLTDLKRASLPHCRLFRWRLWGVSLLWWARRGRSLPGADRSVSA